MNQRARVQDIEAIKKVIEAVNSVPKELVILNPLMGDSYEKLVETLNKFLSYANKWIANHQCICYCENLTESERIILNQKLMDAVEVNVIERVREALEGGADANAKSEYGNTVLSLAASKGYTEIVRLLIDSGADVNNINNYGYTALYWAAYNGHTETAKILRGCRKEIK